MKLSILFFTLVCVLSCKAAPSSQLEGVVETQSPLGATSRYISNKEPVTYFWADQENVYTITCNPQNSFDSRKHLNTAEPDPFTTIEACKGKYQGTIRTVSIDSFKEAAKWFIEKNEEAAAYFRTQEIIENSGADYIKHLEDQIESQRDQLSAEELTNLNENLATHRSRLIWAYNNQARGYGVSTTNTDEFIENLLSRLRASDEIAVIDSLKQFKDSNAQQFVLRHTIKKVLPDKIRDLDAPTVCNRSHPRVFLPANLNCELYGLEIGDRRDVESAVWSHFEKYLSVVEIPDPSDQNKVWGGGYLLKAYEGTVARIASRELQKGFFLVENPKYKPEFQICSMHVDAIEGAHICADIDDRRTEYHP